MTTTEKQAPPACCPVCGAGVYSTDDNAAGQIDRVWLGCGATWAMYRDCSTGWKEQCPHAMNACLRTGATLHPTAREQARDALVEAGRSLNFESRQILAAYSRLARAGVIDKDQWAGFSNAVEAQSIAYTAYLATVSP